ncbi:MAG: single-stranded DNA-binding protein [Flavobacteriales bacterium]|nr:single-stranded DNA-binding protein [Flavobacteriales bacterium]
MGSVNKVILVGNLGKDPEVRHFENGGSVASFPLATTESYKNKETGERVTMPTDWHNISIRRPGLAKVAETYLKKGQQIYVEGKLRTRTYEKDGSTRYITEVVLDDFTMLSSKGDNNNSTAVVEQQPTAEAEPKKVKEIKPKIESAEEKDDLPF